MEYYILKYMYMYIIIQTIRTQRATKTEVTEMTIEKIKKILELHSIGYTENGSILANEVYTMNGQTFIVQVDVTHMTARQLLDWLGY